MSYFDLLAEEELKVAPTERDWLLAASRARKDVKSHQELTKARKPFIQTHGILQPDKNQHGAAKHLSCRAIPPDLDMARRDKNVLQSFPRYSARLLLEFRLLTPLITKDDDPFYLFDNPARKDHIFGVPYLSAASIKGLSVDAYQRAFPSDTGIELDTKTSLIDRIREFRAQDDNKSASRLFGIADDGTNTCPNQAGRLHFSPVWFKEVQYLVMNPKNKETAIGKLPIQFEAIAPNPKEKAVLEVIYFNPYGVDNSDEQTVRDDLARWLAAVAVWWPALGLGAKRLAGYGAIQIEKATLQAVDWSNMAKEENTQQTAKTEPPVVVKEPPRIPKPPYYENYLDAEGKPVSKETFDDKLAKELAEIDNKIKELDKERRNVKGKAQAEVKAVWKEAKEARKQLKKNKSDEYKHTRDYWQQEYEQTAKPEEESTDVPLVVTEEIPLVVKSLPIYERQDESEDSWLNLARWIAGEPA